MAEPRTRRLIVTGAVVAVAVAALVAFAVIQTRSEPEPVSAAGPGDERLAVERGRVLQDAGPGAPVLVEFLDFECEVCAAIHPYIEDARAAYPDDLTVVVRYFPLPSHPNSRQAAHAAEAAALQGQFEPMYQRLFETQPEWSHRQDDQSAVFRGYAEELGLDLEQYDRDVAGEAVTRVEADFQEALSLDLNGTPSLFLDGEQFTPRTAADLDERIARAVEAP